jgi:hypothetical protein
MQTSLITPALANAVSHQTEENENYGVPYYSPISQHPIFPKHQAGSMLVQTKWIKIYISVTTTRKFLK